MKITRANGKHKDAAEERPKEAAKRTIAWRSLVR